MIQLSLRTFRTKIKFLALLLVINTSSGVMVQAALTLPQQSIMHDQKFEQENCLSNEDILSILESEEPLMCLGKTGQAILLSLYNTPTREAYSELLQKCCKRVFDGYATVSQKDILAVAQEIYTLLSRQNDRQDINTRKNLAYIQKLTQPVQPHALVFSMGAPESLNVTLCKDIKLAENTVACCQLYLAPDASILPIFSIGYQDAVDAQTRQPIPGLTTSYTASIMPSSITALKINSANMLVSSQTGVTPQAESGVFVSPGTTLLNNITPWMIANPDGTTPLSAGTKILNISNFFPDTTGTTEFGGNVLIDGNLTVNGMSNIGGANYTFSSDVFIANGATLFVSEIDPRSPATATTFSGDVDVVGNVTIQNGSTLFVNEIDPVSPATVTEFSGDVTIDGVLTAASNVTVQAGNTLFVNEIDPVSPATATEFSGDVIIDGTLTVQGQQMMSYNGTFSSNVYIANGSTLFTNKIDPRSPTTTTTFSGSISLPVATTANHGSLQINGVPFLHNFGASNAFVGANAGNFTMSGSINTAMGKSSLAANTSGSDNSAFGSSALTSNQNGSTNTAMGAFSLQNNVSGSLNTAVGYQSLNANTASGNTAVGYQSLNANTSGTQNVAVGADSLLKNTTGGNNSALGYISMLNNLTGGDNVAVGYEALFTNSSGSSNVAVGSGSMLNNTSGGSNTAVGYQSLLSNQTGGQNVGVGTFSLNKNTTGASNTAVGYDSLLDNTTGFQNTAVGRNSLSFNQTGQDNTAVGYNSLDSATGSFNTAVGSTALPSMTTGTNNIAIGYQAGIGLNGSESNNIIIDANSAGATGVSNRIIIGDGTHTSCFIGGIYSSDTGSSVVAHVPLVVATKVGSTVDGSFINGGSSVLLSGVFGGTANAGSATAVFIDNSGVLGTIKSSQKYKDDIKDMGCSTSTLRKLRPVSFTYKGDAGKTMQYGLVAEEVAQVCPELVIYDKEQQPYTVRYEYLAPMLLNEYQQQQNQLDELQKQIDTLKKALAEKK